MLAAQGKQVVDKGGVVVEILETYGGASATQDQLKAWIDTYGLTVSSLIDAPGLAQQTITALGIRESIFIVEIPSMKILWKNNGSVLGLPPPSAEVAIPEILKRLP